MRVFIAWSRSHDGWNKPLKVAAAHRPQLPRAASHRRIGPWSQHTGNKLPRHSFERHHVTHLLGFAALLSAVSVGAESLTAAQANEVAIRVQQADAERDLRVGEVVSSRCYILRNSRWPDAAVMHARMISTPGSVKRFEVVSMENTGRLQKRVFMQILEGEVSISARKLSEKGDDTDASISPKNYDFVFLGSEIIAGRPCVILQLIPKRKSKYLIKGKAWVDPEAAAVLRVEGQTAASVSFWIGKPVVSQQFRKVDGLWVPSSNRSVSDVRFLGETELTIEYLTYTIAPAGVNVSGIVYQTTHATVERCNDY